MKERYSGKDWANEFQEFVSAEEREVPRFLSDRILSKVQQDLRPNKLWVFSKLSLIHTGVGTLTLLFCPYSELYTFRDFNVMHLLMRWGEQVCMLGCGALFLGGSALAASLFLK